MKEEQQLVYYDNLFDAVLGVCGQYRDETDPAKKNTMVDYILSYGKIIKAEFEAIRRERDASGNTRLNDKIFNKLNTKITQYNACLYDLKQKGMDLYPQISIQGTIRSVSAFRGGSIEYKNKKYKVHIGKRGGKYITVDGKKVYV